MNEFDFRSAQIRVLNRIAEAVEKMAKSNAELCALFERDANLELGDEIVERMDVDSVRTGDTTGKSAADVTGQPPGSFERRIAEQLERVPVVKTHPYSPTCTCTACKTIRSQGYAAADDDGVLRSFGDDGH